MALKYDKKRKHWIDENGDAMRYGYGRWDKNLKQMLQYNSDGTITHYSKKEWEDKQEKLMRSRAQKLTEKRKQAERKYFIPYIKDKSITISGNNEDRGAVISTNMLDSIAKYSRQAGIPFKDGLGLVAQESTLGNAPNRGIGYQFRHSNSNGTWSPKRSNYNGWSPVLITSDWNYIDRNPYSDYKIDRNGVTPQPYSTIRSTLEKGENFEINIHELYNIIWKGSFPRIFSNPNIDWYTFYYSYIQTYIERDIREMVAVDEILFLKFITILASRTGQELNYASIANDINISQPTVKTWISLLKMSGIIYLLQPYYSNLSNRLIKTPKLYFLDTGLVAYLTKYTTPDILENGAINGAILETYVVSEILKSYWHNGLQPNVYFYRDKEKREIDLIIEENDKLYPIEIKRKSNPDKNDIKNFDVLKKFNKEIGEGAVICLSNDELPITRDVIKIPVSYL